MAVEMVLLMLDMSVLASIFLLHRSAYCLKYELQLILKRSKAIIPCSRYICIKESRYQYGGYMLCHASDIIEYD